MYVKLVLLQKSHLFNFAISLSAFTNTNVPRHVGISLSIRHSTEQKVEASCPDHKQAAKGESV